MIHRNIQYTSATSVYSFWIGNMYICLNIFGDIIHITQCNSSIRFCVQKTEIFYSEIQMSVYRRVLSSLQTSKSMLEIKHKSLKQ